MNLCIVLNVLFLSIVV